MNKLYFSELSNYTTPARGKINRIYLHWTGMRYGEYFDDYHINIDSDGELYSDMESLTEHKDHTWRRNTGAIGIAICAMFEASIDDQGNINYGEYPYTDIQIDVMAKVVAKLCYEIGIPVRGGVWTHDEIADNADGVSWLYYPYGFKSTCERWDLHGMGDEIRERAQKYIDEWANS